MKEIFIGSTKEALEQATQVAAVLSEAKDVKPLLWTECFKLGDITFLGSSGRIRFNGTKEYRNAELRWAINKRFCIHPKGIASFSPEL